ncbi:hypothetical protein [Runella zeae]|uniref:hypothetical protein n=1 Tax=Runella zeae TaxID=94255 RepID=UPI002355C544|nr:hypothetical protein [Runella zeae]
MKKRIPYGMLSPLQDIAKIALANGYAKLLEENMYEHGPAMVFEDTNENILLYLVDADEYDKSDFYFKISEYPHTTHTDRVNIEFKPEGDYSNDSLFLDNIPLDTVANFLRKWISILTKYQNTKTIFDNPSRYLSEELFSEFKFVEEDANQKPFHYKQLLLLDQYLEDTTESLIDFSKAHPEKASQAQELVKDINSLQSEISSLPKNEVIKQISGIWSKASKLGMKFLKPLLNKFKEKFIEKLTDGTVERITQAASDTFDLLVDGPTGI